jgi:hypothetical protein
LGITALSCSKSSTGPGDPLVGAWNVTLSTIVYDSTYFTPAPVTLTITKNPSGAYAATYGDLVYHYPGGSVIDTYTQTNDSSSFTAAGDSILLKVGAPIGQCVMTLQGTFTGSTGAGRFWVRYGCGPGGADTASWTATRQ